MKEIKALSILIFSLFVGSIFKYILPFHIPEAIYGMIVLFILLKFNFVKLKSIEKLSEFLISIMALTFVPSGVGLIKSYPLLKSSLIQVIILLSISFIVTLYVTGQIVDLLMRRRKDV